MITNTHLLFSRLIFKHCENKLGFKLSKGIFMYGNIKPDVFPQDNNNSHTLKDNTNTVSEYINKLTNSELTIKKFSLILGMLCHYSCDFFCTYHGEKFQNKSILMHILYEIQLHFKLIILLLTRRLNLIKNIDSPGKDILSIIFEMQKKYSKEKKSDINDLTYALSTAMLISESAICYRSIVSENNEVINLKYMNYQKL